MSENPVCSVHGKPRSEANMIDDGDGGMRCMPDGECTGLNGVRGGGGNKRSNYNGVRAGVDNKRRDVGKSGNAKKGKGAGKSKSGGGDDSWGMNPMQMMRGGGDDSWGMNPMQMMMMMMSMMKECGGGDDSWGMDPMPMMMNSAKGGKGTGSLSSQGSSMAAGRGSMNPTMQGQQQTAGVKYCSTHSRERTAKNLIDDGIGGFCCKPGSECRIAESSNANKAKGAGKGKPGSECRIAESSNANKAKGAGKSKGGGAGPMKTMMKGKSLMKGGALW